MIKRYEEQEVSYSEYLELFQNASWTARAEAAKALGEIGNVEAAIISLTNFLKTARQVEVYRVDQHRAYVQTSIALGKLGDNRAVRPLCQVLEQGYAKSFSDWQLELRRTAAESLASFDTAVAVKKLLSILTENEPASLRETIVETLAGFKKKEGFELMLKALRYSYFEDKNQVWKRLECVAILLGEIGNRQAIPFLQPLLKSEYREVRTAAALAIEHLETLFFKDKDFF